MFDRGLILGVMVFAACCLAAPLALAAPAAGVSVLKGEVARVAPDGTRHALARGDSVYDGDRVITGSRSFVVLRFRDDTRFTLGPKAEFRVDEVREGDEGDEGLFSAEVVRGAFRFVTGLIAKQRERAMRIRTGGVATIGIRGTTVGGEVEGESATIVLLEDEDEATNSSIEVGNAHGSVVISQPGYGTRVPDANSPPTPPERMTLRSIENLVRNINNIQRNLVPRPRF
ncbi:MAG: FecR family protein [Gammaproteobacteria bacterium]